MEVLFYVLIKCLLCCVSRFTQLWERMVPGRAHWQRLELLITSLTHSGVNDKHLAALNTMESIHLAKHEKEERRTSNQL